MDNRILLGSVALLLALVSGGVFLYFLVASRKQVDLRALMARGPAGGEGPSLRSARGAEITEDELEKIKAQTKKGFSVGKPKIPLEERFFQAGMFSEGDKREFTRLRLLIPFFTTPIAAIIAGYLAGLEVGLVGAIMGLLVGLQVPFSILDRRIARRAEDILFYLPLVIEQIAIGVSSSLDIGPCVQRVVSMADERDSHNVVTELLRTVQYYVKSGVSLEDALNEVGKLSGHTELKHSFMSLSQVAKHGGEITRQLQELADAVATQRETKIDAKIKKLELEATAPVALVFMGFLIILLIGFGIQIYRAI